MKGGFRLIYINGKWIVPIIALTTFVLLWFLGNDYLMKIITLSGDNATENISTLGFFILLIVVAVFSFLKNLSLIPVCGLLSCSYLLTGMAASNWVWFFIWLLLGLVLYFSFGFKNSKLNPKNAG
jgi:hypothetical protein